MAATAELDEGISPFVVDLEPIGRGHPHEHCVTLGAGPDEPDPYCVTDPLGDVRFAPVARGAAQASLPSSSTWPILTTHSGRLLVSYWTQMGVRGYSGRAFAAARVDRKTASKRWHAGVDLFGRRGDVVVAPEDGRVIRFLSFHAGTWAVYLRSMLGDRVLNLGEVARNSWREFGVAEGQTVLEGQPLARIGLQDDGATMLHFEAYEPGTASDEEIVAAIRAEQLRWLAPTAPLWLRDPSAYLVMAATRTYRREQAGGR